MEMHSVDLDLGRALASPKRCSACGAASLRPESVNGTVVFRCRRCKRSWNVELGSVTTASTATTTATAASTGRRDAAEEEEPPPRLPGQREP